MEVSREVLAELSTEMSYLVSVVLSDVDVELPFVEMYAETLVLIQCGPMSVEPYTVMSEVEVEMLFVEMYMAMLQEAFVEMSKDMLIM